MRGAKRIRAETETTLPPDAREMFGLRRGESARDEVLHRLWPSTPEPLPEVRS